MHSFPEYRPSPRHDAYLAVYYITTLFSGSDIDVFLKVLLISVSQLLLERQKRLTKCLIWRACTERRPTTYLNSQR